jgi:hypothetical protein
MHIVGREAQHVKVRGLSAVIRSMYKYLNQSIPSKHDFAFLCLHLASSPTTTPSTDQDVELAKLYRKVYSTLKCVIKCSESIRRKEHDALKVL